MQREDISNTEGFAKVEELEASGILRLVPFRYYFLNVYHFIYFLLFSLFFTFLLFNVNFFKLLSFLLAVSTNLWIFLGLPVQNELSSDTVS